MFLWKEIEESLKIYILIIINWLFDRHVLKLPLYYGKHKNAN
jgi:hypothetical protein